MHKILGRDRFQQQSSLLPDPNLILEQQLFTKLSDYYNACMNQDMIEAKGIVPLYTVFREIKQFLPLNMHEESSTKGLTNALMSLSHRQIWAMFEMNIIPDYTHPSTPSIEVVPGQVGLPTRESYDDPDIVSTYMSVVTDILDIIFKRDTSGEFGWRNWSPVATARRIVEFEKKIAQSTITTDQIPKQYTLDELQQIVPEIEWATFIQAIIPGKHTLHIPNHVSLPFPNFIQHLSQDVLSTANTRTLQTYLIWRSIWKYLDVLGEEFVSHKRRLDAKLRGIEPRARPERWETCLDMIDHSPMGMLLGHYFILNKMNQTAKAMVEDMSVKMIHTLKDRVPHLEWAQDQQTKDQIINKVI